METEEYYGGTYPDPPNYEEQEDKYEEDEDYIRDIFNEMEVEE